MNRSIAGIALRPDEQQEILSVLGLVYLACELTCGVGRLAVDLEDDVARWMPASSAGLAGRTFSTTTP